MRDLFKRKKEVDSVIKALEGDIASPDAIFVDRLEKKLVSRLESQNLSNFSYFIHMVSNKLKVALPVLLLILFAGGTAAYLAYPELKSEYVKRTTNVDDILAKMAQNNSLVSLNTSRNTTESDAAAPAVGGDDTGEETLTMPSKILPYDQDSNYNFSSTKTSYGPAQDKCQALYYTLYGQKVATAEYYSYYGSDAKNGYMNKNILKDSNGNIIEVSVSGNDYYRYIGGKYAVVEKYSYKELPVSVVESEANESEAGGGSNPVEVDQIAPTEADPGQPAPDAADVPEKDVPVSSNTTDDPLKSYFGDDAKLSGVEEVNGEDHYVIEWSYQGNCDYGFALEDAARSYLPPVSDQPQKISVRAWVDQEDYTIAKDEYYLGSISSANLVVSNSYSNVNEKSTYSNVSGYFDYIAGVDVREFEYSSWTIDEEKKLLLEKLKSASYNVLTPASLKWEGVALEVSSFYMPVVYRENQPENYLEDRNFYPDGARGDQMYASYVDSTETTYVEPVISLGYSTKDYSRPYYVTVDLYPSAISDDSILNSVMGYVENPEQKEDVKITVDGVGSVTAKHYEVTYEAVGSDDAVTTVKEAELEETVVDGGSSSPGSAGSGGSTGVDIEPNRDHVYIFTVNGSKFVMRVTKAGTADPALATFKLLDSADSTDYAVIKALVDDVYAAYER